MNDFLARPWLLLAAPIIYWLLKEFLQPTKLSGWASFLPPELAQRLLTQSTTAEDSSLLLKQEVVFALLALLFSLALAGVGYTLKAEQLPSEQQELVVIQYLAPPVRGDTSPQTWLDISQRALIPLLNARQQGKTALIYYAGSAHLVSPMTEDSATLRQLLSLTHPSVMPLAGHAPEAAFRLAAGLGRLGAGHNLASGYQAARLDWLWLTDDLPSAAVVTQLLSIKPKQAQLYLIGLNTSLATIEQEQAAFANQGITLLHPNQLADYVPKLNRPSISVKQKNQQGIRFFQELSHWPLLAAILLLLWHCFEQPRFKFKFKNKFNAWLLVLLLVGLNVQQPLQAANRTDLTAHAEFALGHYAAAAELFAQWQAENAAAKAKQQAEMHFNTGTAWLLAEQPELALAQFNQAAALVEEWPALCNNRLLAEFQLNQSSKAITRSALLKACGGASEKDNSEAKDDLENTARQQQDWQPQAKTSCVDCKPLNSQQEKQLQQLQEDPWRLLRVRFKNELREQQP